MGNLIKGLKQILSDFCFYDILSQASYINEIGYAIVFVSIHVLVVN
jgi:hypothetical protein